MDQIIRKLGVNNESQRSSILSLPSEKPSCKISYIDPECKTNNPSKLKGIMKLVTTPEELEKIFNSTQQPQEKYEEVSLFDTGYSYGDVQDWELIIQPAKDNLYFLLRHMMENQVKTDIQININEMFFNCHLIVLQAYSKFFMEISAALVVSLPAEKVSEKAFMIIYQWMLSDNAELERKDILEVFQAATYLRIDDLLDQCWYYFDDVRNFFEDTACVFYIESMTNPAFDVLRGLMLTRICKFFMTFVASKDFLDMPAKHLIFLLKSNVICVNTEIEVFYTAVRWLEYKWHERRSSTLAVMQAIRFHLMPIWYLLILTRCEETDTIQYIVTLPEMDHIVNIAITKVTDNMYDGIWESEPTTPHPEITHSAFCDQRRWIQDKDCPYHHLMGCPNLSEFTYAQFLAYLRTLQLQHTSYWSKGLQEIDLHKRVKCCVKKKPNVEQVFDMRISEFC